MEGNQQMWLTQPEPPSSPESDSDALKNPPKMDEADDDNVCLREDDDNDDENENDDLDEGNNTTSSGMLTQEEGNAFPNSRTREHLPSFSLKLNGLMGDEEDASDGSSVSDDYGDVDDDESSTSSEESLTLTLTERRLRNEARNKERMSQLNAKYKSHEVHNAEEDAGEEEKLDDDDGDSDSNQLGEPRGMLFKTKSHAHPASESQNFQGVSSTAVPHPADELDRLRNKFPYRESQIYLLTSLIGNTIAQQGLSTRQGSSKAPYVPAPIFVTGPGGTAKTSVVKDVIDSLKNQRQGSELQFASAYVNCGILEPSSIERLVSSVYSQLNPSERNPMKAQRKKRSRKRRRSTNVSLNENSTKEPNDAPVTSHSVSNCVTRSAASINNIIQGEAEPVVGRKSVETKFEAMAPAPRSSSLIDVSWTMHSVVGSFGRALRSICGRESKSCAAILVLDNADRLLSLSMKKTANERTNFLSELLILPKAMELNLTVIIISNNCCLSSSRLNSLVAAGKSVATLSNGVQPYTIQFPAYKGAAAFKTILCTPQVLRLVVGDEANLFSTLPDSGHEFRRKVVDKFLGALVQSVLSATRDLREFVRLGRSLWPVYIQPLLPSEIETTMGSVAKNLSRKPTFTTLPEARSSDLESELLALLDKRFLAIMGKSLGMGLHSLSLDSPIPINDVTNFELTMNKSRQLSDGERPYLQACLLLAAFICQNNKADKDKRVFSIQGSGNKRTRRQSMETTDDIAYISRIGERQHLRVVRPRPFPLERMLSIFVTLVSLNPPSTNFVRSLGKGEDLLPSLGSSYLNGNLAQLCDLGYLHEVHSTGSLKSELVALSASKYWCSLSKDEAISIAASVDIPLNNYLI